MRRKIEDNVPFRECIKDLYKNDLVKSMKQIEHHKNISCFQHSLEVAYISYKIAKKLKLDYISIARGAFLHDFYLYDWHEKGSHKPLHGFHHPKTALKNAKTITDLNKIEIDIISKHMWPLTLWLPKYKESWIVQFVDKLTSLKEILHI